MTSLDQKAIAIAQRIADLWNNYSDENSVETDLAMRDAFKEVDANVELLDHVDGVLASPLKYFTRSFLYDENPEDLTISQMVESLEVSIGLMRGEAAAAFVYADGRVEEGIVGWFPQEASNG